MKKKARGVIKKKKRRGGGKGERTFSAKNVLISRFELFRRNGKEGGRRWTGNYAINRARVPTPRLINSIINADEPIVLLEIFSTREILSLIRAHNRINSRGGMYLSITIVVARIYYFIRLRFNCGIFLYRFNLYVIYTKFYVECYWNYI